MLGEKQRETVLKVSLAGLFHDVGKFAQGGLDLKSWILRSVGEVEHGET